MAKRKMSTETNRKRKKRGPLKEANALPGVRLRFIRLIESHSSLDIRDGKPPTQMNISVSPGYAVRQDGDEHTVGVLVKLEVNGRSLRPDDEERDVSEMKITADFECKFVVPKPPDEKIIPGIISIGVLSTWPIAREHVLSTTSKMGQRPFLLPLLFVDAETNSISFLDH